MDIASDLTSSSPGIIAAIFEQFVEAALRRSSLSDAEVFQMINFALAGTSKLLVEEDYTFSGLIERVATKGGITAEGIELSEEQLPQFLTNSLTELKQNMLLVKKKFKHKSKIYFYKKGLRLQIATFFYSCSGLISTFTLLGLLPS